MSLLITTSIRRRSYIRHVGKVIRQDARDLLTTVKAGTETHTLTPTEYLSALLNNAGLWAMGELVAKRAVTARPMLPSAGGKHNC